MSKWTLDGGYVDRRLLSAALLSSVSAWPTAINTAGLNR